MPLKISGKATKAIPKGDKKKRKGKRKESLLNAQGSVLPNIHAVLLPKSASAKGKT